MRKPRLRKVSCERRVQRAISCSFYPLLPRAVIWIIWAPGPGPGARPGSWDSDKAGAGASVTRPGCQCQCRTLWSAMAPCCHFYQIRRLHESCCLLEFLSGPLNAPDGEKYKYIRTTFRTKSLLSFLEIITFMSFSFDIFLRLKKRDKENEKLYF